VGSGAFESDTRTSKNTWLPRKTSAITDTQKERAQTDIQLQEERDKNIVLNETIDKLNTNIHELKQEIVTMNEQHANELQTLKKLLHDSMRRETRLRELNQEAYTLLTLYGIQNIPVTSPRSEADTNMEGKDS
jgi:dGTP triphosphohydrolase